MLHFILGRAGFGKTHEIYERIAAQSDAADTILLVPEQYSFESERAMLRFPQEKRAEVLSFSRLCNHVFKQYGGVAGTPINDGQKLLLMSRALRECQDQLQVYRRLAKKPEFATHMLAVVQECGYSGITPQQLEWASMRLPDGILKNKTREIALVASVYHGMVRESYLDEQEELERLYHLLSQTDFWHNKRVFVDSFKDFTAPQKKLLEQMIAQAKEVTVALCADRLQSQHNLELFANTKGLAAELIRMAQQNGVEVAAPTLLCENHRAKTKGLVLLEQVLSGNETTEDQADDSVIVCACQDKYDQAEYVAATICRLVREEGLRYRDITILSRDASALNGVLDRALERYEIPYFSDWRRSVMHQPFAAYALKGLRLAAKGWDTAQLLSLLKTGLSGFSLQEIALLENYTFTWNVKGSHWLHEFRHHPDGMGAGEADPSVLEQLNALRKRAIGPVLGLKQGLEQGTTVQDHATALFEFFENGHIYSHLQHMAQQLTDQGNSFEGEDLLRSVDLLNGVLDQMVSAMGSVAVTPTEFLELFELSLQSADMGKIPQGIDQVVIGNADRTRPAYPKAVFVLDANQGVFPAVPSGGGLLSDTDRKTLKQVDLPLTDHCEFDTVEESFLFYTAAVAASERVFFTYLVADSEKTLSPCVPLEQMRAHLPEEGWLRVGAWEQADPLARVRAPLPALDLLAARYREGSELAGGLYHGFQQTYPHRLQVLRHLHEQADCRISPQHAKELFGQNIFLSPTGVEVYHKCGFSYFCRYGLRIQPRRQVALDVMAKGTVVHYVLEQMLNRHGSQGLYTLSQELLQSNVHEILMEYVEQAMGGLSEKAHTFRFQLQRIEILLISLLNHMAEEMKHSRFETAACELVIGPDGKVPALTIPLPDGGSLSVVGVVDRLDVYEQDGVTYFRVLDYKTGTKTFRVEDLYYGIGLQMFLYLYAVEQNGQAFGSCRVPAGVLYMPARRTGVKADGDEEKAKKEIADRLCMKGVVLDHPDVVRAMEPEVEGRFIPVSLKKDGKPTATSALASIEFFGKTRRRIEQLLTEMGVALQQGEITCDPLDGSDATVTACQYCDFKGACPLREEKEHRKVPKMTAQQKRDVMKGGDYHGV